MNRSAIAVGAVLLLCGVGLLVIGIRGLLSGEPASTFDLAAGLLLSLMLLAIGCALAGFEFGQEIDDRGRRIVQWRRWRGFRRREVSTSFDSVRRLRLVFSPGAKYSPPVWRIMAEIAERPPIQVGWSIASEEALAEGRRLASRIGVPFPQGLTEWAGRDGEVNCSVSLGTDGLTVGEYTDDPHQLNDSMTVTLEEFAAPEPHGRGAVARGIIRDRLGSAVAAEVDEAIYARSISQHRR